MAKKSYSFSPPHANEGNRLKTPSDVARIGGDNRHPVFCLHHVDSKYCISNCEKDDKANFADRLRDFSKLTWLQIKSTQRHGFGSEKLDRKSSRLKCRIPDHLSSDVALIALRFSGLKAMVGYRDLDVFHIIGFDKDFDMYDHGG